MKNNDFDVEDKERSEAQKKFDDEELEVFLLENSYKAQAELAGSLGVDHTTISKCLKTLRMIQKHGYRVLYELKPRDVKRPLVICEQQL